MARTSNSPRKKHYREALKRTFGSKAEAADLLGVSRSSVTRACQKWPELEKICEEFIEDGLDRSLSTTYKAVCRGEVWAIEKYFRYYGYRRGMVEHKSLTGRGGEALIPPPPPGERLTPQVAIMLHDPEALKLLRMLELKNAIDVTPTGAKSTVQQKLSEPDPEE